MKNFYLLAGALIGFLAVAFGAFGAHAMKGRLSDADLQIYHTAATYQMYHAFALLAVGILSIQFPTKNWSLSGISFIFGTLIFSGSLYALVGTGVRALGAITPIGGLLLMVGWLSLAYQSFKS